MISGTRQEPSNGNDLQFHTQDTGLSRTHLGGESTWTLMREDASITIPGTTPVKWGSATRVLPNRPTRWGDAQSHLLPLTRAPRAHDVLLAQVVEVNRHTGIELDSGRKAKFYAGDILGLVFGHRYATRQFLGDVPPLMRHYHILSQGGVCGRVLSAPPKFSEPTLVRPLGYWRGPHGDPANLQDYALQPMSMSGRPPHTVVVVGSSMDAGKSTTAASLIRGLSRAGSRVHAGKITGTACVKDLNLMADSGALRVLDFSQIGYASTAQEPRESIAKLCQTMISHLSQGDPDFVVLEVADGITQRETRFVLDYLTQQGAIDDIVLAVHDALAAPTCVDLLHDGWSLTPTLVSGVATISPLSSHELRALCPLPCFSAEELADGAAIELLQGRSQRAGAVTTRAV